MAAALSLAMPKEAFDQFLADTYGIDGLNKLEVADARGAATASTLVRRYPRAFHTGQAAPDFFFVDYLPTLALRAASGRA